MHALFYFEMKRSRNSTRRKYQPHQKLFQRPNQKKEKDNPAPPEEITAHYSLL
jgi:hypothetical protein